MFDDLQQEPAWRRYSRMLGFRPRRELADEIEFHLQMRIDEFVRAGPTPEQGSLAACALPARRASRVDAALSLRAE